jgi:threonine/homoserine/homoserine lactone efflux protein
MGSLLAQTVPLSIGAAISPIVLMSVLTIIGGHHGKARAIAFAIGFVIMSTALLIIGALAVAGLRDRNGGATGSTTVDVIMGIVLIAFGLLMVRPKRKDDETKAKEQHRKWVTPDTPLYMFTVFGLVLMLVNVSTIVLLIAILKEVARSGASSADAAVALGIADLFTILPAAVPVVAALIGGAAVAAKITHLGQWTNRNGKYILCVLFVVFGLQDLLKALGH